MTERKEKNMPITDADIERAIQNNLVKLNLSRDATLGPDTKFDDGDADSDSRSTD